MAYIDRLIRRHIAEEGLQVFLSSDPLANLVMERLSGTVDGANRSFFLSRLPVPGMVFLFLRGRLLEEEDDYSLAARGRNVMLHVPPAIYGDAVDRAPRAIYVATASISDVTVESSSELAWPRLARRKRRPLPTWPNPRLVAAMAAGIVP